VVTPTGQAVAQAAQCYNQGYRGVNFAPNSFSHATFQPSNRSANIRLTRFIKGLRGLEMQKTGSAALVAMLALASFITLACNGTSQNSNQPNSNTSLVQPKIGKWIPQFRSEYSKQIVGTNLGLYSYSSLSVVSADVVCAAGDMPDPKNLEMRVGVFIRTTDGGKTWKEHLLRIPGLEDPALNSLHFVNANTGWIVGVDAKQNGILLKTTDGGETWAMSKLGFKQIPTTVFFTDENTGYMGGVTMMPENVQANTRLKRNDQQPASGATAAKGKKGAAPPDDEEEEDDEEKEGGPSDILTTTDGGKTWISQRRIASSIIEIFFLNPNVGWAAGYNGVIYHTTNGGQIWTQQRSELEPLEVYSPIQDDRLLRFALYGIHFLDEQNGMAAASTQVGDQGRVLGTTTSGAAWARKWIVADTSVRDVLMISPTDAFAVVGAGTYVYHTVNGGSSWLAEPIEFEQNMTFFRLGAAGPSKIWASGGGAIFFRIEQ
jgi:photosystem II stability/assembly factor-like uncharacterized protein